MSNNSNCQKLDAVLPLTLKDYERFQVLQKSLNTFCKEVLGVVWIVVPDSQFSKFKQLVIQENYCVIPESSLIPEIKLFSVKGWYLQQLIKISIADHIKTDFYLTLDADVICVQSVKFTDLVKNGRAVYTTVDASEYENRSWYEWSRKVLNLKHSKHFKCYDVTPAVLSREVVLQLQNYLEKLSVNELSSGLKFSKSNRNNLILLLSWLWCRVLRKESALKKQLLSYRAYLIRNIPWTEYALYYTFCEIQGLLEQYHVQAANCICAGEESVWHEDRFEQWKPETCFEGERAFFFCVVQSNTNIAAEIVLKKVEKFLK